MSESDLPVQRYADFANTVSTYVDEVKKLADRKRDEQIAQAKLFAANAFKLSDDPTLSSGPPTPLKVVPYFNFAPIENAVTRLKASAKAYDAALAAKGASRHHEGQEAGRARRATEQALVMEPPASRAGAAQTEHDLRARPLHRLWREDAAPASARRSRTSADRCRHVRRPDQQAAPRMPTA
jgi:N-acetylated-alpha-linked acidic dipeptidase